MTPRHIALALLSRAAPALNIFAIGFPVKITLTLLMLGLTFPLLPPALDALLDAVLRRVAGWIPGTADVDAAAEAFAPVASA